MKKFVVILALLTLTGCASQRLENQWKGRSAITLTSVMGTPDQIKYDGLAKKVYIYVVPADGKKADQTQDPNQPVKVQNPKQPANMQTEAKVNMFWINRNGLIEKAKQQSVMLKASEKIDVPTSKTDF